MTDIVICIIPKLDPIAPTVGPAALKAHLQSAGYSCRVIDYNVQLYNYLQTKELANHYYYEDDSAFESWITTGVKHDEGPYSGFQFPPGFTELYNDCKEELDSWIQELRAINPKWIGLSMLSRFSCAVGIKMCQLIREHIPQAKIVIGGGAVRDWNKIWIERGWIDYYIFGDSERAIIELLDGNINYPGINSAVPVQIDKLDELLVPDYSDITWSDYKSEGQARNPVFVTASRGCVKRCDFCDVPMLWPQYKFRSGAHVTDEIMTLYNLYDRKTIKFTDSLINGSMKAFRDLLSNLAQHNTTLPDGVDEITWHPQSEITWSSQWIVRPKNQSPESDFELMKSSGCCSLEIGIESFSERIRFAMGKKFTDEDMWWCFEMLDKYEIPYQLLMIVGYPTETEADHQHTLNSVRKMVELGYTAEPGRRNRGGGAWFSFGNTLLLEQNLPIWEKYKDEVEYWNSETDWKFRDNDLSTRLRRFIEVNELVDTMTRQEMTWLLDKSKREYEQSLKESNNFAA
tara:strand:+ start:9668 stop:11212 length:1545 start_codon:yes stop_codon:yes gene_type:complete